MPGDADIKYLGINSVDKVLDCSSIELREIISEVSGEKCIKVVCGYIVDLNEFFNFDRLMSVDQIKNTAGIIINQYPKLQIHELWYIFTRAKMGVLGEMYGSIDGNKILIWIKRYLAIKLSRMDKNRVNPKDMLSMNERSNFIWGNLDKMPGLKAALQRKNIKK